MAETCLFLSDVLIQCFSQSCIDDLLKTLLVMGRRVMPLQVSQSPKSPFLGNLTMSLVFYALGIILLSHISLNMPIKRHIASVSSALSISAVTPSTPPAYPLFITLRVAFTSSMVGGLLTSLCSIQLQWDNCHQQVAITGDICFSVGTYNTSTTHNWKPDQCFPINITWLHFLTTLDPFHKLVLHLRWAVSTSLPRSFSVTSQPLVLKCI